MDKKEIQDYLTDSFNKGLLAGKIRTKKEFAEQIGVNPSSLSAAFRGNELYLTDNLVAKCRAYVDTLELDELFPSLRSSSRTSLRDTIPVLPTGARAGTLGDFAEGVRRYDCEHMIEYQCIMSLFLCTLFGASLIFGQHMDNGCKKIEGAGHIPRTPSNLYTLGKANKDTKNI